MAPTDIMLAVLVACLWGAAFPAISIGLESFSPGQLVAMRFLFAAIPVLFLARPAMPLRMLVLIALPLFAGQFLLLFSGYEAGMPSGVASVVMQSHVFFTVLLSAAFLGDRPSLRQLAGMAVSFAGLALIAATVDINLTYLGLALTLGGALSWATGNVMLKATPQMPNIGLVAWLSMVPPIPALVYSAVVEDAPPVWVAAAAASWQSWTAAIYLGLGASLLAYAFWAGLLRRYPAAAVAPYALLAPCVGMAASAILFGERFGAQRYAGLALVFLGVALVLLPIRRRRAASAREGL